MKQIIITTENYIRAAVLEEGRLLEVLEDEPKEERLAGNIYKGKVINIVPGIQAAFIDIGLKKNAFLYVGDVQKPGEEEDGKALVSAHIENLLKEGQEVVVQISREPVGGKGARVTTRLSLPGRYAVLLPGNKSYLGISREITEEQERARLLELGAMYKPAEAGLIIRTLAEGVEEPEFRADVARLQAMQEKLKQKISNPTLTGLVYSNNDLLARLLRETIDERVEKIIIDDGEMAELLRVRLREIKSPVATRVWTDLKGDLFERYNVNYEIRKALLPKVPLESGGYLVIEQTEALHVVDVNSGKYIGKNSLQDTLLHLNLEAAEEIARQIKLRNLSGMIILDFIDLEKKEDWEELLAGLKKFFLRYRVKGKVMGITNLGLVEVTRKKEGQTLKARYTEYCPHCGGKGWLERTQ
ncbi:MAG TPA: Rne/Rng family ribonuclease [Peptococcaceae bacterium]|nr:Rne/Rng family ribonuclease [Peptococcaceae bacterium]